MSSEAPRISVEDVLLASDGLSFYSLRYFDDDHGGSVEATMSVMSSTASSVSAKLRYAGNSKVEGTRSTSSDWKEGMGFTNYKVTAKYYVNKSAYDAFLAEAMSLRDGNRTDQRGIMKLAKEVLLSVGVEVE